VAGELPALRTQTGRRLGEQIEPPPWPRWRRLALLTANQNSQSFSRNHCFHPEDPTGRRNDDDGAQMMSQERSPPRPAAAYNLTAPKCRGPGAAPAPSPTTSLPAAPTTTTCALWFFAVLRSRRAVVALPAPLSPRGLQRVGGLRLSRRQLLEQCQ
jgi:hypothetical protein